MTQTIITAKSTMILAAGAVASVLLSGTVATTANAATVYFGYETSFREAKQMCNGMHGRIFETERGQYGCTGDRVDRRKRRKITTPEPAGAAPGPRPTKRQNFTGRRDFSDIGRISGGEAGGNGGGGGGGGGGGSAGGRN